jgi:ribosomal protein S18 acetylase RimI-like enzyme
VIGPLDASDPQLHPLLMAAYRVEAELIGAELPGLRETPEDVAAAGLEWIGAWEQDQLVGAMALIREGDLVDIHRLVVHPDAFRRGVASALLAQLPHRVVVSAAALNEPALALYARHGFRVTGERVVRGGIRILDMRRP